MTTVIAAIADIISEEVLESNRISLADHTGTKMVSIYPKVNGSVSDADIDKIQAAGISNSGQYKLAGNSIVVDVLYHLFRKMFIETEPDVTKSKVARQLSLF